MEQKLKNKGLFSYRTDYIGVLDGIRVIAILIVLWFHYWQQTWLMPYYPVPHLKQWFGIAAIDFNMFRRCGYLCVDWMILLSGFVCFLPYARHSIEGKSLDTIGRFYLKRFARIVPCYIFAVLCMFLIALKDGQYTGRTGYMYLDLITHLTFTFMFRPDTYLFSCINGVFWTLVIEVYFYAVFPLLAKWFMKKPLITYIGMVAIGIAFTFGFCLKRDDTSFMVNRFLTFLPVFANGMIGAYFYVWFVNRAKFKPLISFIGTAIMMISCVMMVYLYKDCSSAKSLQIWQLTYRYPLSIVYLLITIGVCVSIKPIRMIFSNAVFRSLALISYNLYLWHQFIIVRLRMAMGFKSGADTAAAGVSTQWILHLEALTISILIAILTTYCIERPLRKFILKIYDTGERK